MFSKGDILGYKANLHKYEKLEIVSCVLSGENEIHLETNNKRDLRTLQIWKLKNAWFYDQYLGKEIGWELNAS